MIQNLLSDNFFQYFTYRAGQADRAIVGWGAFVSLLNMGTIVPSFHSIGNSLSVKDLLKI